MLADKQIEISGASWLKGQKKVLSFAALTTNCLCKTHNSSLSPIDDTGARFFEAIQKCGTTDRGAQHNLLLSGHDVERWMLRTLAAFGVSKNLSIDGARLDQQLIERLRLAELLEDPTEWNRPLGMYFLQKVGHKFTHKSDFQLAPLVRQDSDRIVGILLNVQGLELAMLADHHDIVGTGLDEALYRPRAFVFQIGKLKHRIQLSWEDDLKHQDVVFTWDP